MQLQHSVFCSDIRLRIIYGLQVAATDGRYQHFSTRGSSCSPRRGRCCCGTVARTRAMTRRSSRRRCGTLPSSSSTSSCSTCRAGAASSRIELQTNLREDFIITEKASTREHRFVQATFNNLCAIVPISRLLTVFRRPFSIA